MRMGGRAGSRTPGGWWTARLEDEDEDEDRGSFFMFFFFFIYIQLTPQKLKKKLSAGRKNPPRRPIFQCYLKNTSDTANSNSSETATKKTGNLL